MQKTVCLVTGAGSGLGYAVARGAAREGAAVIMMCSNERRARKARVKLIAESQNPDIDLVLVDWSSQQDIRRAAETIQDRYPCIDLLFNLAEAYFPLRKLTEDGIERNFAYNVLAPFLLVNELSDTLIAADGARIFNLTHESHRIGSVNFRSPGLKHSFNLRDAQRQVALARVSWTYELDYRLAGTGVVTHAFATGAVHPAALQQVPRFMRWSVRLATRLWERQEPGTTDTLMRMAFSADYAEVTGKYLYQGQMVKSSPITYNDSYNNRLWELCEKHTYSTLTTAMDLQEMLATIDLE